MTKIQEMSFLQRINLAQTELKAPKGQFNKFGNFKYRSAEDILEAVKPVNLKYFLHLDVKDDIVMIGDRIYVKAICTLSDVNGEEEPIVVTAFAREPLNKKGMDDSQITGTASSYARKYALNGLYLIDDTKDADTDEHRNQQDNAPAQPTISTNEAGEINKKIDELSKLVDGEEKQNKQQLNKFIIGKYSVNGNKITDVLKINYKSAIQDLDRMIANNSKQEQTSLMEGNTTKAQGSD